MNSKVISLPFVPSDIQHRIAYILYMFLIFATETRALSLLLYHRVKHVSDRGAALCYFQT